MKKATAYELIGMLVIIIAVILICNKQFGFMILALFVGLCFLVHGISLASFGVKPKYKLTGISLYGLPQGESQCACKVYKDHISFEVNKNQTIPELCKVCSAVVKTSSELQ